MCCLAAWLCLCAEGSAASPVRYERAKQELARLEHDPRRSRLRAPWERVAAAFRDVYDTEKRWRNRPAALYRSALALDALARRSGRRSDALKAENGYLLLARRHAAHVLADDALYRAALLRREALRDVKGAAALLRRQLAAYPEGDQAGKAAVRLRAMAPESGRKGRSAARRTSATGKSAASAAKPAIRTVLLDAGHGGDDPGAAHNGVLERRLTLDLAKRAGAILAAKGFRVRYTRFDDRTVSLERRADRVRSARADVFVSIHVNAHRSKAMHGLETYQLDFGRTSAKERRAAAKNALRGRSPGSALTPQRLFAAQPRETRRLARAVHRSMLSSLKKGKFAVRDGGLKTASLYVLRRCGVPGVLVEVGYCTNKREAERLSRREYRAALARGIAEGVARYARALAR